MSKIPLYILHGRLGVGKTTILTGLLKRPEFSQSYVVENEFAGHSVDGSRLSEVHPHVRVYEISGACVCCTGSDSLMSTLLELANKREGEAPVIVETTGAADAAFLMKSLLLDPVFHDQFALKANILVVDALASHHDGQFLEGLNSEIVLADYIVLTKTDLLAGDDAEHVFQSLEQVTPGKVILAQHGNMPEQFGHGDGSSLALDALVGLAGAIEEKKHNDVSWQAMTLPPCTTESFVEAITKARANGAEILRVKGKIVDHEGVTWRVDGTEYLTETVRTEQLVQDPTIILIGKNLPLALSV